VAVIIVHSVNKIRHSPGAVKEKISGAPKIYLNKKNQYPLFILNNASLKMLLWLSKFDETRGLGG
jgi:hypothetical protein